VGDLSGCDDDGTMPAIMGTVNAGSTPSFMEPKWPSFQLWDLAGAEPIFTYVPCFIITSLPLRWIANIHPEPGMSSCPALILRQGSCFARLGLGKTQDRSDRTVDVSVEADPMLNVLLSNEQAAMSEPDPDLGDRNPMLDSPRCERAP